MLYPFAPWESGAAHFVNMIGNTMGPIFGVMMVDYYLIRKGRVNVEALYREDGEFRFQSGWHVNALDRRRHRHPVLVDPARAYHHHAGLVGRLWLVLRRGDLRRHLLRPARQQGWHGGEPGLKLERPAAR